MSDAYSTGGHITVQREIHEHTHLVEVWVLENLIWTEESSGEYDVVKCHVAQFNDVMNNGIPHQDNRVTALCSFDETPEDVQEEFIEQVERIQESVERLSC